MARLSVRSQAWLWFGWTLLLATRKEASSELSLDFNGLDICLGCQATFMAQYEPTVEALMVHEIVGKVGRMQLLPNVRMRRRVRGRNCPKCGGVLKPIRKSVSGGIRQITETVMRNFTKRL